MSQKISRRAALGTAAAMAGSAMLKNAEAQTSPPHNPPPSGHPAPPPTSPPGAAAPGSTTGKDVTFPGGDATIKAYLAAPANAPQPRAAIVVIHEIWGLNEHIRDVARRFAAQGYLALAPDLFTREGPPQLDPSNREALMKFIGSIPDRRMVADLKNAITFLKNQGAGKVGSVGFCMGGLYSYLLAVKSDNLTAAVDFYGRIVYAETNENKPESPLDLAANLQCPLLANFGETDQSITVAHVEQLKGKLAAAQQPWKVNIYPGVGHAFFNDTRPSYNAAAARDAWQEMLTFFKKHLA